jgi:hypothetical protein
VSTAMVATGWRRAASTATVVIGGVESRGDLESFRMKSETTRDGLLFIGLKPLLIVLKSGPKRFWFQTTADEDIISSDSKLEPLLIS